jgi:glycosyltransferase involved in cell wall biosynthesis
VLGSAQYSDLSWVNCQHVATGLSARHPVLFVDSIGLRTPQPRHGDLKRIWARLRDAAAGLKRPSPNLAVLSPALSARVPQLLRRSIRSALSELGMSPAAVIAYLPTWAPIVESFGHARRIYHCVDEYSSNPGVDPDRILRLERRLLESTDMVWAVSNPLAERLAKVHPNVRLLPNVADVSRFAAAREARLTSDLPLSLARPIVLYLGNLASYKVDLTLLERLARMRPDWSWVLVGPVGRGDPKTSLESLLALPQVHCLGEVSRDEAPSYVAASDVCLLPLRRTRSTAGSAPLKIFEYLAAGRPVVSTPIPAVAELARKGIVRIAVQDAEWISAIEESLRDAEDEEKRRHDEAMSHGWEARIDEIERLLFP